MVSILYRMLEKHRGRLATAGPQELPQKLRDYLLNRRAMHPNSVDKLLCVLNPMAIKHQFAFRIFNPIAAVEQGVTVKNFQSLEGHQDLVLFEGDFNTNTESVNFRYAKHMQHPDFQKFFGKFFN